VIDLDFVAVYRVKCISCDVNFSQSQMPHHGLGLLSACYK